jgi:uncharacterized Rmd1/YagE family protein
MTKTAKKSKTERLKEMQDRITTKETATQATTPVNPAPKTDDMREVTTTPNPVAALVEAVAEGTPAETTDKPKKPKKDRKSTPSVVKYLAQPHFKLEQVIKILIPASQNPKKRHSQIRYALYEDGMTVGEYIDKSNKAGNPKSLAANDVRWDYSKGFINVE